MPVEMIIKKIRVQEQIILEAMKVKEGLLEDLENAKKPDYDWVTISEASRYVKISIPTVYKLINDGRLKKIRHVGSKKFISLKEITELNDKPKKR